MPGSESLEISKPNSWKEQWKQLVEKKLTSLVMTEFQRVVPSALAKGQQRAPPLFHRTEIEKGERIGSGGFSDVFEVKGFNLREDITAMLKPEQRDARQIMADSAIVNGKCQYAIKHLQPKLLRNPEDFLRAAADLAVEASFLASLEHPNIVSLQGTAIDGLHAYMEGRHDSFFLIMERLEETLEHRVNHWKSNAGIDDSLERKIEISRQLSEALRYLHQRRIVFRDLKPANIGFSTVNDTMKLFDFGLCRELPIGSCLDEVYNMSDVGTRRYMAVETVLKLPYNCKADVFGWSMVFWEMLMLTKPFYHLTYGDHTRRVCVSGERPYLPSDLPCSIRRLLQQSWEGCVSKRLSMDEVCSQLDAMQQDFMLSSDSIPLDVDHSGQSPSLLGPCRILFSSKSSESLPDISTSLQTSMDSTDSLLKQYGGGTLNTPCSMPEFLQFFKVESFLHGNISRAKGPPAPPGKWASLGHAANQNWAKAA